jgi:hypothetical protein
VQKDLGVESQQGQNCPDRLWDPPSLVFVGYWGLFSRGVNLTTHFRLLPRWRMSGAIPPLLLYDNNIIITMAQQPYMGPGLLLPPLFEVTKSCAFVAVGDWWQSWCARQSHLAGSQETWRNGGYLAYATVLFMPVRFFYMPRHGTDGFTSPPKEVVLRIFITLKNPSTSVGIEPANLGSSGEHTNH